MSDANQAQQSAQPAITIIMPTYNVVDYLDQCLESVVNQTFRDFEVLAIDDGSTDGSGAALDAWATRDDRIQVIHKANEGVSPARNLGLDLARGTYVCFVDPDDWLELNALELMYAEAIRTDADYIECDLWRYNNKSGTKIHRSCAQRMGVPYTLEEHMKYGPTATYKAISKLSLWNDNGVRLPSCSYESPAVYALILGLAKKIAYVPVPLYYYRRFRENSLVETGYGSPDGRPDPTLGIEAMEFLASQFEAHGLMPRFKATLPGVAVYRLNDILAVQYQRRTPEDFAELVANCRAFIGRTFPELFNEPYVVWGGYNLNRIMVHRNALQDPSCRFNFQSVIAVTGPDTPVSLKHRNRYREMMLEREVSQEFWRTLERVKPAQVVMDFIEERFDIVEFEGRYLTKSDAFDEAEKGFDLARARIIPRHRGECTELWKRSFEAFVERARAIVPALRFVFVENYLSERVGDLSGTQAFDNLDEIRETNELLRSYYAFARECCPDAAFVPASTCQDYFTDAAYEYGAIPSHLNEIVNQRIAALLEEVTQR